MNVFVAMLTKIWQNLLTTLIKFCQMLVDIQSFSQCSPSTVKSRGYTQGRGYRSAVNDSTKTYDHRTIVSFVLCVDYWYVNVDGREGWLPSTLLTIMTEGEPASRENGLGSSQDSALDSHGVSADGSDQSDTEGNCIHLYGDCMT